MPTEWLPDLYAAMTEWSRLNDNVVYLRYDPNTWKTDLAQAEHDRRLAADEVARALSQDHNFETMNERVFRLQSQLERLANERDNYRAEAERESRRAEKAEAGRDNLACDVAELLDQLEAKDTRIRDLELAGEHRDERITQLENQLHIARNCCEADTGECDYPTEPTADELAALLGHADAVTSVRHGEPWCCDTEVVSPRQSVLNEAGELIHGPRNAGYGNPDVNFRRIAEFWTTFLDDQLTAPITPAQVGVMSMLIKMAREIQSPKRDNFVDAIGYLACSWECVNNQGQ